MATERWQGLNPGLPLRMSYASARKLQSGPDLQRKLRGNEQDLRPFSQISEGLSFELDEPITKA
jgi:hypothetical protein